MTNTDKALLLAEWGWPPSTCPVCRSSGTGAAHQPNCAMDLALAERGYALQEDRSRGRADREREFRHRHRYHPPNRMDIGLLSWYG